MLPEAQKKTGYVQANWTTLIDSEGLRARATNSPTDPSCLDVVLEGGERLSIPRALVLPQEDGSYRFEQSFHTCLERVAGGEIVLPLVGEELHVGKRAVERERLRVVTSVATRNERVDVPLLQEHVVVERIAVDRIVEATAAPRQEGNTLVIPVYEEVLVVQKRLVLKEEVRITRTQQQERHAEQVTLRREEVSVERLPTGGSGSR